MEFLPSLFFLFFCYCCFLNSTQILISYFFAEKKFFFPEKINYGRRIISWSCASISSFFQWSLWAFSDSITRLTWWVMILGDIEKDELQWGSKKRKYDEWWMLCVCFVEYFYCALDLWMVDGILIELLIILNG